MKLKYNLVKHLVWNSVSNSVERSACYSVCYNVRYDVKTTIIDPVHMSVWTYVRNSVYFSMDISIVWTNFLHGHINI